MNPGNNEEIRVSIPTDKTQLEAGNKALEAIGKTAVKSSKEIEVFQRSTNSLNRTMESAVRRANTYGLSGFAKEIEALRLSFQRLQSSETHLNSVSRAWDRLIAKRAEATRQEGLAIGQRNQSSLFSIGSNVQAPKDFAQALAKIQRAAEEAKPKVESLFGSFMRAGIALEVLDRFAGGLQAVIVHTAKYAAATEMYGTAARAIAKANNISAASVGELEKRLISLGITTQESRRAISQAITAGIGTNALPQLARMAQDVAVLNPTTTSSDTLVRIIYGIQSAQTDVLRTAGINVNFEKSYSTFAKANNRTTDSLTENEKAMIRLQNVLDKGARFAGTYEAALGDVGKQMQTMDRFAKEAANAIGNNFLPALRAVVSTSMWALDIINKNPAVASAVGVGSGVMAGAGVGAGAGFLLGGPPGAIIGAKIGAGAGGTTAFLSTAMRIDEENRIIQQNRQAAILSAWNANGLTLGRRNADGSYASRINPITREQRIGGMLSAAYGLVPQEKATDTASGESAKRIANERFKILEAINDARERELTGIAKINAEHQKMLRQLKEEKLDTADLVGLAGKLKVAKLEAFVESNRKRVQNFRMDGVGITAGTTSSVVPNYFMDPESLLGVASYEKYLGSQRPTDTLGMLGKTAEIAIEEYDLAAKAAQKSADKQLQAYESMYNRLRSGFESSFDSIIRSGANAASILRNLFLSALLTPIKQAASAMFANLFMPIAMGGRGGGGGFSAAGAMSSGLGMAGMIGPGGTAPFVGGGGGGMGRGIGSIGSIGGIGAMSGAKMGAFSAAGIGSLAAAGGGLGVFGAFKAGQSGNKALKYSAPAIGAVAGMTAMGGLMAMFPSLVAMGPVGLIAAGAIGAVIGMIGMFKKTAEQKARDKIKAYYGIDISDKGILTQIVGLAKQSYGGNLDVAVRAREIRDLIELYAMSTGQRLNAADNRPMGVNLSQMGGSFYQTGSYSNGVGYSYGGSIAPIAGLSKFAAAPTQPIALDRQGTQDFLTGMFETGIVENPRAVQAASLSAQSQNYGRTSAAVNLTDPLGATI